MTGRIDVEFKFGSFSQTVSLSSKLNRQLFDCKDSHHLTLSTLQKDNPISWISDWLTWYCRSFGVSRLILYDNNSNHRTELLDFFHQCPLDLEIIFIDWPFPHGIEPYKYCQRGTLNHCRVRFPVSKGYCLNFDIDEYLWFSDKNLLEYLNHNLSYPRPGAIAVRQYIVPNIQSESEGGLVRCWHFKSRERKTGYQGEAKQWNPYGRTKYIYSFDDVGYNAVHSTDSDKNREFRKRYSKFDILMFTIKKVVWESTKRILRFNFPKPRIDTKYSKVSELCFFTFLA